MSAAFLLTHEPTNTLIPLELLDRWVPFIPSRSTSRNWRAERGHLIRLRAWSVLEESARGSYWTWCEDHSQDVMEPGLCFQGWVREPDELPISLSVAEVLMSLCGEGQPQSLDELHRRPGQFCCVYVDPTLRVHALSDAFCGQHLYYAQDDRSGQRRVLVSNRAGLIAAYLDGVRQQERGDEVTSLQPRRPDPFKLGWLLTRNEAPLGDHSSAWSEIKLLTPGTRLTVDLSGAELSPIPMPVSIQPDWDQLYQDLLWRARQLKRLPDVPFEMALTGGLDSRLIFGALREIEALDQISTFFVHGTPQQADLRVAEQLAREYDIPLRVDSAVDAYRGDPFLSQVPRHHFLVDYMINAWDLKSGRPNRALPSHGALPGHFGELYRSHGDHFKSHSYHLIKRSYQSLKKMNRHRLLKPEVVEHYLKRSLEWLADHASTPSSLLLDDLHREARMWRWAGHTQMYESLGYPSINLLPDLNLRAAYASMSLSERLRPRVHFELMRRVDERLAWLPFAKHRWPHKWTRALGQTSPAPVSGAGNEQNRQIHMWRREQDEIGAFLLDERAGSLWSELVDQSTLARRIQVVRAQPGPQSVKGILAAAAIKYALEYDLTPHPLHVAHRI